MKKIKTSTLVMLLLAAVLMAGCKKETESESNSNEGGDTPTSTVGHVNPNPAQNTPLSENFLSEFQSVYQLYPNADGSFYALAQGEHTDYLLHLDNNGYVQQRIELGFRSRRCITKIGDYIVLLGNMGSVSSAPYGMYKQGYVAVYDRNMQLVATLTLREDQYNTEIYSIVQDSNSPRVFYVGGFAVDDSYIQYPYLCTLQFSEGLMTKVSSKIYSEYEKCRIVGLVEKQSAGQNDLILETIRYTVLDSPYNSNSSTVHITKLNYFDEVSGWGNETWDVAITGAHGDSYTGINSIDSDENNIYFFGYCNDDKEPAPSSGYWDSGLVAAVNWHQGQTVWTKTVSLTNKDERFYDGFLSGGYLYVCGSHSGLRYTTTKKDFGNGLVVKLSLTGELVAYKTFGEPDRYSGLYHIAKDANGKLACVGWSGENLGDDKIKYSGWFLKTEMLASTQKALSDSNQDARDNDLEVASTAAPMEEGRHGGGM